MEDKNCDNNHEEHLCVYANNKQFEKIAGIAQNPKFICYNCGRVAEMKEHLCNPVELNSLRH